MGIVNIVEDVFGGVGRREILGSLRQPYRAENCSHQYHCDVHGDLGMPTSQLWLYVT